MSSAIVLYSAVSLDGDNRVKCVLLLYFLPFCWLQLLGRVPRWVWGYLKGRPGTYVCVAHVWVVSIGCIVIVWPFLQSSSYSLWYHTLLIICLSSGREWCTHLLLSLDYCIASLLLFWVDSEAAWPPEASSPEEAESWRAAGMIHCTCSTRLSWETFIAGLLSSVFCSTCLPRVS